MNARSAQAPPGLTLIEVIFAVAVMAVALLAVASMFPTALQALIGGGNETQATALARSMLDMLRSQPFSRLAAAAPSGYNGFSTASLSPTCPTTPPSSPDADFLKKKWTCEVRGPGTGGNRGLPGGVGQISVSCLQWNGSAGACDTTDLRQIAVTIMWQLPQGQGTRSITMVTYAARQD
jgi:type IV pilus modification protein PilV